MTQTTIDTMSNTLRLSQASSMILTMFENPVLRKHSVMLFGPSGIGKSQVVAQVAAACEVPLIDIRLSQWDAVDARGVPTVRDGRTTWCPPNFLPDSPKGILFFDEVTSAPPSVQTVAYQATLDRKIGEMAIPDGWMVILAGNLQSDRGITHTLAAPLVNRMLTLFIAPHIDDWSMHAAAIGADYRVIAFLRVRPDLLHKFVGTEYTSGKQFPSPRGWMRTSDILTHGSSLPESVMHKLIIGSVGEEAGASFMGFLNDSSGLVSIDEILRNPNGAPVPTETHKQYALAMGLASKMDKFTYDNGYVYLKRLSKDLQMLAATLAYHKNKDEFKRAKMFADFAKDIVAINKL